MHTDMWDSKITSRKSTKILILPEINSQILYVFRERKFSYSQQMMIYLKGTYTKNNNKPLNNNKTSKYKHQNQNKIKLIKQHELQ